MEAEGAGFFFEESFFEVSAEEDEFLIEGSGATAVDEESGIGSDDEVEGECPVEISGTGIIDEIGVEVRLDGLGGLAEGDVGADAGVEFFVRIDG